MENVLNKVTSRSKLALIAAVAGGVIGVAVVSTIPKWFPTIARPDNNIAILSAYVFLILSPVLPFWAVYRSGSSGNVPPINGLFRVLHWTVCLGIVALAFWRLPSYFMNMNYDGFSECIYMFTVAVAIFPLRLGRLRTTICWTLGILSLVLLTVGRLEPMLAFATFMTFLVAGICAYMSAYGSFSI
jgi:hypothetical protein